MFLDGRTLSNEALLSTDVCIVGGGPAGLSLALDLAREPRLNVLILESGGFKFDEEVQDLARGSVLGLPYYPLHETRIRALGGSSMSWGGICTPLDPLAFEERPWVPDSAWPFPREALHAYADTALSLCKIDPKTKRQIDSATASLQKGFGLDAGRVELTPVYFSPPVRFGSVYRPQLEAASNITVVLYSTATRLETNATGEVVVGLGVRCRTGTGFRVAASKYVLAGGGIENARLLLSSNQVQQCGVGNARDNVGRYFMEHPRIRHRYRIRAGHTPLGRFIGDGLAGTLRFVRMSLSPVIQQREQLLNFHANLQLGYAGQTTPEWEAMRRLLIASTRPWNDSPYFQDAGGGRLGMRARDVISVLRRPDRAFVSALGAVARPALMRRFLQVYTCVEQVPDRLNRVRLSGESDPLGVPRAQVEWNPEPSSERTYRRGLEIFVDELEKLEPGLGAGTVTANDPWPTEIVGNWHHIGTTRMHHDPRLGVVDANCRVHDVANLFVAGSSVFPVCASTSPTFTIILLSLRLADHLRTLLR